MTQTQYQTWLKKHLSLHNAGDFGQTMIVLQITPNDVRTWTVDDDQVADQLKQIDEYVKQYFAKREALAQNCIKNSQQINASYFFSLVMVLATFYR